MRINDPSTLAEVSAAFERYEAALVNNDIATLDALFLPEPTTIRYGVAENLYGIEAIRAFRIARVGGAPQRILANTVITTFGRDFATANTEFQREGAARPGRRSQTWVRFAEGWRVVAAHVSLMGEGS